MNKPAPTRHSATLRKPGPLILTRRGERQNRRGAYDWFKRALVRAGLPYIATHPDFNCPTETGFAPDIGAIMAFIEASTGRRADLVVGKPHTGIVQAALSKVSTLLLDNHLRTCVTTAIQGDDAEERERMLQEITSVFAVKK